MDMAIINDNDMEIILNGSQEDVKGSVVLSG